MDAVFSRHVDAVVAALSWTRTVVIEQGRAKFSAGADGYTAELDEATWRKLRIGRRCRLTVGAFSDEVKEVVPR